MKIFITIALLALLHSAFAKQVQFGLLVCEDGPVLFAQTSAPGTSFQVEPPSVNQCPRKRGICNEKFGFFSTHSGLLMCAVTWDCGEGQQTCLRRYSGRSNSIIGCCKVGLEGWALSGVQKISGDQKPRLQERVRINAPSPVTA